MRGAATLEASRRQSASWVGRNPDIVVVFAWIAASAILGFLRRDFTGDGVRHLAPILTSGRPSLGEPRWLLFPVFLFVLLRPLVSLGLVTSVEEMTRPMMAATVTAAAVYLFSLRLCLAALGVSARKRALALLIAAFTGGLFFAASDLMEPIFAAALAMAGLAFAAARQARPSATEADGRSGALVAIAAIAAASFLYQGVILAIGLVPLFVPVETLRSRKTVLGAFLILAAVPLLTTALLVAAGNTVGHALSRFLQGEENPLYRSFLKRPGLSPYLVALIGGPPQGVLAIPEFHGFNALIVGLRTHGERWGALNICARLALGLAVIWGVVLTAFRRRQYPVLLALVILVVLPVVRHQQYGYLKYYILLPVIVAVAATHVPGRVVVPTIVGLAVINGAVLIRRIQDGRALYEARQPIYSRVSANACWVTTGWGPPLSFRWGGSVCGVLLELSGGSGNDTAGVIKKSHAHLTECLERCFCGSSAVYTDDMLEQNAALIGETVRHFQYAERDLTAFTTSPARATLIAPSAGASGPIYEYPADDKRKLCGAGSVRR